MLTTLQSLKNNPTVIKVGAIIATSAASSLLIAGIVHFFPKPKTKSICDNPPSGDSVILSDYRRIGYTVSGDHDGSHVLFVFHGIPGSRKTSFIDDAIAKELGVKIITVDRPGIGVSSLQNDRTILSWPKDIQELATELNIEKFAVLGFSLGAPYALACAYSLPNNKLINTAIASGIGIYNSPKSTQGMHLTNRMVFWIARFAPTALFHLSLRLTRLSVHPENFIQSLAKESNPYDKEKLSNPEIRTSFTKDLVEEFREGPEGHIRDVQLVTSDWGFQLENIPPSNRVFIWHGTQDNWVPIQMAENVAQRIPNVVFTKVQDTGHLFVFNSKYSKAILEQLFFEKNSGI